MEEKESETEEEIKKTPAKKNTGYTMYLIIAGIIFSLVIAGFAGWLIYQKYQPQPNQEADSAVAIVNNESISQANFEKELALSNQNYSSQGVDVTVPENKNIIESEVLDLLINKLIVIQSAEAAGITVSEADIDEQYQIVINQAGGEDALNKILDSQGVDKAQLAADLHRELMIQKYLSLSVDVAGIAVTDEEAKASYDKLAETETDLPPLDQIFDQIKQQLLVNKQQVVVNTFVDELRAKSQVEILR